MKNLKFRIWDKQLKVFLYQLPEKHHLDWERFDVQQFTGLLDRLDKEIYEGDIVEWLEDNLGEWNILRVRAVVGFESGSFRIKDVPISEWGRADKEEMRFEVIGNIYKNPELLEI